MMYFPEILLCEQETCFYDRTNGARSLFGMIGVFEDILATVRSIASYLIRLVLLTVPLTSIGYVHQFGLRDVREQPSRANSRQANTERAQIVQRLPIPLPPLAEQTRIVAEVERRLSVVEELESVVSANLQRATASASPFCKRRSQGPGPVKRDRNTRFSSIKRQLFDIA